MLIPTPKLDLDREVRRYINLYNIPDTKLGELNRLIYTQGQCLAFALMLRQAFLAHDPKILGIGMHMRTWSFEAIRPWISTSEFSHFFVQIGGGIYDIIGDTGYDTLDGMERDIWLDHATTLTLADTTIKAHQLWPDYYDEQDIAINDTYFGCVCDPETLFGLMERKAYLNKKFETKLEAFLPTLYQG